MVCRWQTILVPLLLLCLVCLYRSSGAAAGCHHWSAIQAAESATLALRDAACRDASVMVHRQYMPPYLMLQVFIKQHPVIRAAVIESCGSLPTLSSLGALPQHKTMVAAAASNLHTQLTPSIETFMESSYVMVTAVKLPLRTGCRISFLVSQLWTGAATCGNLSWVVTCLVR